MDGDSNFDEHREATLRAAKSLVEQTKNFVGAVSASPDQLADCAQSSAELMTVLAGHVKKGAATLSGINREGQLRLLNAVKGKSWLFAVGASWEGAVSFCRRFVFVCPLSTTCQSSRVLLLSVRHSAFM